MALKDIHVWRRQNIKLRHGMFQDGGTLPQVLTAARLRHGRRLRFKDLTLPLFYAIMHNVPNAKVEIIRAAKKD